MIVVVCVVDVTAAGAAVDVAVSYLWVVAVIVVALVGL